MKNVSVTFCVLVFTAVGIGCDAYHNANAKRLIEPASIPGKAMLAFVGTGEQLVKQGRISLHRRLKGMDGCEIDVWVINSRLVDSAEPERKITRGTVVLLHPLVTSKLWFLSLGENLARYGWDVVLPDLRAHGRSGGKYITWGAKEKHDLNRVVDQLVRGKIVSDHIYILGSSMGGAVAIQYAAIEPRCKGVMAIAPPASFRKIARRILLMESPANVEEALVRAGQLGGFDPDEASAVAAAGKLSCPLVIVHGALDCVVPFQHSKEIFNAAPEPKRFIRLPIDGHASEIAREQWIIKQIDSLAGMADPVSGRLDKAIGLSAGYLVRACGKDGKFVYRISTNPKITPKPAYNVLRHAGAIYALAMYEQRRPDKKTRDAIARAVGFLKKETIAPMPKNKDLLGVWSRSRISGKPMLMQVKLGGVGLGLVALLSAEKAGATTTPIDDLRKMGRCILFMQKEDGSFYSKYIPARGGLVGEWVSLYYPGEAALGLLMLYEKDPSPAQAGLRQKWLDGAARAITYLARTQADKTAVEADQWTLLAMAKLLPIYDRCKQSVHRELLLRHARRICNSILAEKTQCRTDAPEFGSFGSDARTCPVATRAEGLLAALTFLPAEDKALRKRIADAASAGISFLLRNQIRTGKYAGGIPRAMRPLPKGHPKFSKSFNRRSAEVRIDYVQHAMCAMMQFEQLRQKPENERKGNH